MKAAAFFGELKRRNVLRGGVLYIGAVWALAQGISQLGPSVGLPDWATRWFLVAAVVGFPFWLAFAWFYEFTPTGLKREREMDPADPVAHSTARKLDFAIIGVLTVAVVLLLTNNLVSHKREGLQSSRGNQAVEEDSIAVLPFINRSSDKSQDYFADGISEDMLNLLARVPKLKVISRSSSFSFKGKDVPLKQIALTLGVAYILEGSVQRAGRTLRISAQLVDARDDRDVWSQSYDRTLDDVFKIQDEVAGAVVGQLKLKLFGKAQAIDPDVYATYLQARQLVRQNTRAGYTQAISLSREVLAKAPSYAFAWDMLGRIYINQASKGLLPVSEGASLAREALDKALVINPDDAHAQAGLGYLELVFTGDLPAAARQLARALALDPADPGILGNAAILAQELGRLDDAIALHKAQIARDPVSASGYYNLGIDYYSARQPDAAIASLRTALSLSPEYVGAQFYLGVALLQKGEAKAALAAVQQESDEGWRLIGLAIVDHALGQKAASDASLAKLIKQHEKDSPYNIAYVFAYRGEVDRAFAWLDKAQQYQDSGLSDIAVEPLFDNLHRDPRWLPLLHKLGKTPEQLDRIAFKVTLPDTAAPESAEATQ